MSEFRNPVQFIIRAGDDFGRDLQWLTGSLEVPVDLTNSSVEFSVRGGSISWQFVDDEHVGVLDAEYGQFFIRLSPSETRALRASGSSSFSFEVTVEFSELSRRTVLFGVLVLSSEVIL